MYDVIIVGGGPAGATLARFLGRDMKVLVLDRRDLGKPYAGGFEKCCGGLLAPDAQKMLARFGLGLPRSVLAGPQLFTVRTIDMATRQQRFYPRDYINIDRERFDRWLVSLLPPEVETCWGARFRYLERDNRGVRVTFTVNGKERRETCRLAVGADGARSLVRRALAPRRQPQVYVAIQEWFAVPKAYPYYSAVFDPAVTDFYSWTIPKDDLLVVGSAIPAGADVLGRFQLLKDKLAQWGYVLDEPVRRHGTHLLRPAGLGQICLGSRDVVLIGEAAGWISPSSAEGLSYAFRSALALARALEKGTQGAAARYRRRCRGLSASILAKLGKSPAMYWPWARQLAMGSGLFSLQIEFEEVMS
ncbi:MAG: FAD-binding protein [Firmicutes bacterium]|nr:FAD-binding protein [Bacillota bacterium]